MVVFDNTVLSLLLHPDAEVPNDPATGQPVARAQDRIRHLVEQLQEGGTRILIPAPVLAEFLTVATAEHLTEINQSIWFEVAPFDQRAAIESAVAIRRAIESGKGKKLGLSDAWQKIKIDRQLVAIAKVNGAGAVYTTDATVIALARESGLQAFHAAELPLPPENAQPTLPLDSLGGPLRPSNTPAKRSPDDDEPK